MKNLYCEKCNKNRPHQYIGREHDFDGNILGRVFVGIATVGFSEIIGNTETMRKYPSQSGNISITEIFTCK